MLVKDKKQVKNLDGEFFWFLFEKDTLVLVCDDNFDDIDLQSACFTLGFNNGKNFQKEINQDFWTVSEVPLVRYNMNCGSSTADFLSCSEYSTGLCAHSENVLVTCEDSSMLFLVPNNTEFIWISFPMKRYDILWNRLILKFDEILQFFLVI